MAKFQGGVQGAVELLQGLDPRSQKRILADIAKQDPAMAELIKKNLVRFEDLIHLTEKMMAELLREVDFKDLALGLRLASEELKNHFRSQVSSSMAKEIDDVLLGPPQSVSRVEEAIERVMEVVRRKVEQGELVLRPDSGEYV